MKRIGSMRRLLAWACLLTVFLVAAVATAARIEWKTKQLKEKKVTEDEGRWHIELTIYLDRAPDFANMPVKFEFKQQSSVERYMEGESDKIKTRTIPITTTQPIIESVDLGFLDPSTGSIQKRTKFAFDISRAHGFEAGDWDVKITDGRVYVNDIPLDDGYVPSEYRSHDDWGPSVIPEGYYFVMGDHRNNSSDSRHWGMVPKKYIIGKVQVRWWPLQQSKLF